PGGGRRVRLPAASRYRGFSVVREAIERKPWTTVALLRLSPVMPSGLKSYAFGLMRIDAWTYLHASLAGMLPGIVLKVYVGAVGREALSGGGAAKWALLAAGVAATLALAWVLRRTAQSQLHLEG
ncbi:MAG: TVP38/TMEM64 family protein, partial [Betaproteobacteria bacterium]